jgi:esterase FrsA
MPPLFGQFLLHRGVVTEAALERGLEYQRAQNRDLETIASRHGLVSEADLERVAAKMLERGEGFAEVAKAEGLLSADEVARLYALKHKERVLLGDALVAIGAIDRDVRDRELAAFLGDAMEASSGEGVDEELPLKELKDEIPIQARMHDIEAGALSRILRRIERAGGDGAGSWVGEWVREGDRLRRAGKHLEAARHYSMGRYPYIDGPAREDAYGRCLASFHRWVHKQRKVELLVLRVGDLEVPAYGARLGAKEPLLLVMGGVVSVKEQWCQFLKADIMKFPVIALDFPGTGEAPFPYDEHAVSRVGELVAAILSRVGADHCFVIAPSFSGPIFARVAARDPRIAGIVMPAAPLVHFFDPSSWPKVPRTTQLAVAAAAGRPAGEMEALLPALAVPERELASLRIPVTYIANLRDEIIPAPDRELIEKVVPQGRTVRIDDTHGAPNKWRQAGLEMMTAILEMTGRQRTAFGTLVRGFRRMYGAPA